MKFDDDCTAYHDDLELRIMERELTMAVGNQPVCRCKAYPYPHRMGYGLCDVTVSHDNIPLQCPQCGSEDVYRRIEPGTMAHPDVSCWQCGNCDNQWGHE